MLFRLNLDTERREFRDITPTVRDAVSKSGVSAGICLIYCPHTTAGITINENADPDVPRDMLLGLELAYPDRPEFRHAEGNSTAHLRAGALGASASIPIEKGALTLGTWQGIWFCEFDGPRRRHFLVKILAD
ncbi:MAG: secondary thiamine-phosphate synthase enzyme YjbQ [Planctomycetota bacterium]|jgi:secondary thiamine-phosphate synthase enzyme|nr:secondary thiamine-phosphate synthase enzyme YjbQ [Planctomycetota bacterium]